MHASELIRLRNRITALEANGSELLARAERAEAEEERMRATPVDWDAQRRRADELEADNSGLRDRLYYANADATRAEAEVERLRAELAAARAYSRGVAEDYNTACDERDALKAELALHVGCRVDISIGDALRLIRGGESNAPAPSPVTAATEAHGETTEAQEGSPARAGLAVHHASRWGLQAPHAFAQDHYATEIRVCRCGERFVHHVHGGKSCGCDDCRAEREV